MAKRREASANRFAVEKHDGVDECLCAVDEFWLCDGGVGENGAKRILVLLVFSESLDYFFTLRISMPQGENGCRLSRDVLEAVDSSSGEFHSIYPLLKCEVLLTQLATGSLRNWRKCKLFLNSRQFPNEKPRTNDSGRRAFANFYAFIVAPNRY